LRERVRKNAGPGFYGFLYLVTSGDGGDSSLEYEPVLVKHTIWQRITAGSLSEDHLRARATIDFGTSVQKDKFLSSLPAGEAASSSSSIDPATGTAPHRLQAIAPKREF
jgi:hypothetical protein